MTQTIGLPEAGTVTLRRARQEDIPALTRLMEQSVRQLLAPDYTPRQIESALKYILGIDPLLVEDGTYFVAEQDGRPVGSGGWSRRRLLFGGEQRRIAVSDDDLLDPARDAAPIRAFFVHPEWARRGIGRMLLQKSEAEARAAGFRQVELGATYVGARLYAACGYEIVGPLSSTLPDGVTVSGYLMTKSLSD